MAIKKNSADLALNLQNGEYCHFLPNHLVINSKLSFEYDNFKIDLSKTKNNKKARLVLNVFFTLIVFSFAFYTQFYPLALLLFVSLWDLRHLKRFKIPKNKAKIIPINKISEIKLSRGKLGFNYLDIYVLNEGVKSFIPLQLYESESTLAQAKTLVNNTGKLTSFPETDRIKLTGPSFHVGNISSYVLHDKKWHYCEKGIHSKSRVDTYQYLRVLSWFLVGLGLYSIGVKIYAMNVNHAYPVDFVVLAILASMIRIPYKYLSKALPNTFEVKHFVKLVEKKKKSLIVINIDSKINWKIYVKNSLNKENLKTVILQNDNI